jgi:hypothetical protein
MADMTAEIPPVLAARLARPTVRLSGAIDEAAAMSFLNQILPVLEIPGSIVWSCSAQAVMPTLGADWLRKSASCARLTTVTCGFSARRWSRRRR